MTHVEVRAGGGDCPAECWSPLAREPLSEEQAVRLSQVFKAMGDPVRLRLVSLIASHEGGEACVCDLTDAFDLTGPTISHHLKVLREAGLITGERRGTWVYYRVRPDLLGTVRRTAPAPLPTPHHPGGGRVSTEQNHARLRRAVVAKLSTLDRFLPVWIVAAMAVGLLAGG